MSTLTTSVSSEVSAPTTWKFSEKLLFRFFFSYFIIYIFPFPLSRIPFTGIFSRTVNGLYDWFVPLVGQQVFGITEELARPGGSGDTTYNYLQLLIQISLAVLISILWTIMDRKRRSYQQLFKLGWVFLRYFLALTMLQYGMSKIFVNQFPNLRLFDLIQPYGDSSPMALMWNFMGYSSTYSIFGGLAEFIGGMLLFFRRTVKLGALIIFAVMLNVFLMNMSYDIPVKLFSFHLMLMAVFILVPYYKELLDFFVRNQATLPNRHSPYFSTLRWNIAANILKGILILHTLVVVISNNVSNKAKWGSGAPLPPLYGIYEVQDYILNKDTLAPLTTDTHRWSKLVIDKRNGGIVKMDDRIDYVRVVVDTTTAQLELSPYHSEEKYELNYHYEGGQLLLQGKHEQDEIDVILNRKDEQDFLLVKRGFNWINEYPYNM